MDGSAANAGFLAIPPAPRRAFPPPASCIQNRSGESGRPRASMARAIAYIDVTPPPLRSAFLDHFPHFWINFPSARSISGNDAPRAARRGLTTISHWHPISERCIRKAARMRRLMRLRTTDPPIARGTVSPRRAELRAGSGRARQNAANKGPERRIPLS